MALRPKALRVQHAYEQVSTEIEAQILSGDLKPGDRLPSETEMATMFGINRSTVREGIRRLESEGFVRRVSPRKMVVSIPRMAELASRQTRALSMLDVTFEELWQVSVAIEPLSASLAAQNADADDIARLEENHAALQAAQTDALATIELDTRFHSLVAAASKNRVLQLAREPVGLLLYSGFEALVPKLPQAASRQIVAHAHVIEAIRARDATRAHEWMRRHIDDFKRGYIEAGLPLDAPIADSAGPLLETGHNA